ncbi:MAG: dTDP-4-dehydrorhamnose reductase [Bradyrhizobium sp.]|nr:MAG: dTDP-4-dehydrorhamnose reductase [Bradyrhizobium sp.]
MRIVVTGKHGQVASALRQRAPRGVEIVAIGRPEVDIADRAEVMRAFDGLVCDAVVNAAAYTAVDRAEAEPDAAMRVNADGAAYVAEAAAKLGVPLLHLSTDYVFNGRLDRPYREDDIIAPATAYGRSKAAGEGRVAATHPRCVILRTAWVYSPFGANFMRTMLRLAETRDEIAVVDDQRGNPTSALDLADALLIVARRLVEDASPQLDGLFHLAGTGEASWADVAEATFAAAARLGRRPVKVKRIASAEYPTAAPRPRNSRLNTSKFAAAYGFSLPEWTQSLPVCVERSLAED